MKIFVSLIFTSGRFLMGIAFGIPAGFFEEIGWTGYAFPKIARTMTPFAASILVGLPWGLWHLPVIDFLGTATPHGRYLLPYFLAFIAVLSAMRVRIGWIDTNTRSILLAQCMHASSTGAVVVLSPPRVNAAQEALWYAIYAAALWVAVVVVVVIFGTCLNNKKSQP
jgi:membrane protease YdiL (CAAX protease family)